MRIICVHFAKLNPNLKELRLHFCQNCTSSKGVRDFVHKYYPYLKKDNPALPILIRECNGVRPRVWARFSMGIEKTIPLADKSAEEVIKTVQIASR